MSGKGVRIVATGEEGAVRMYKDATNVWTREEYLADIANAVFVDLPLPGMLSDENDDLGEPLDESHQLDPFTRYQRRWAKHIQQAGAFLSSLLQGAVFHPKTEPLLTRDQFGFKKLIVAGCRRGMVVAMETITGKVVWRKFIGGQLVGVELVRTAAVKFPPIIVTITKDIKVF